MARSTPAIYTTLLIVPTADGTQQTVALDSPDWYRWLSDDAHQRFTFTNSAGKFTARKERKQQGGWYWIAYRQVNGTLYKTYLGKAEDLSLDRLSAAAATLTERARSAGSGADPLRPPAAAPLLATKFLLPPARPQIIPRPRLFQRLQAGLTRKLTLLSAPAGAGKTTLLSEWMAHLANSGQQAAWLSLDLQDNDPIRFWRSVIEALYRIAPRAGDAALALLPTAQPPQIEAALTALINALTPETNDLILALDDYHVITASAIHETLAFLLNHLPPPLHVMLASRTDPAFPLARLRALGQCLELRGDDLRFTQDEATAFLNQRMDLNLDQRDVALLEGYTEGWAAGLQLVALSLQERQDRPAFIRSISGNHAAIRDYLLEEVLGQQPEAIHRFLLHTALLDQLSGPLCDAVTGQPGSQALLLQLERANLFLLPLDEGRQWYRYHPLFADVLRASLRQQCPQLVPLLHQRAAAWYAAHGFAAEAIGHALALPDDALAARLIAQHARATLLEGRLVTVLHWLEALPGDTVRTRPDLCLLHAWALLLCGRLDTALTRLREALASLQPPLRSGEDTPQTQRLADEASVLAGMVTALHGAEGELNERLPETSDRFIPDDDLRSLLALSLGWQATDQGDLESASRWLNEAIHLGQKRHNLLVTVLALCERAELHIVQGQLHRASACYRRAQRLAQDRNGSLLPIAGIAALGMGALLREWNDLAGAAQHLHTAIDLCTQWAEFWAFDGYLLLARVHQAQGQLDSVARAIQEAERIAQQLDNDMFSRHLMMTQVRLWLMQGNIQAAAAWIHTTGLRVDDAVQPDDEPQYLLLARVLLAQDQPGEALQLLARLRPAIEAGGRNGRLIELLALQAVALQSHQQETAQALSALERALALAAPEGYLRLFVELGAPLAALLRRLRPQRLRPDILARLLAACARPAQHNGTTPGATSSYRSSPSLPAPLTKREEEVLRRLAVGASNQAIAGELVVTVGTVKKHVHNLFGKLQAQSRTQLIAKARALRLV